MLEMTLKYYVDLLEVNFTHAPCGVVSSSAHRFLIFSPKVIWKRGISPFVS